MLSSPLTFNLNGQLKSPGEFKATQEYQGFFTKVKPGISLGMSSGLTVVVLVFINPFYKFIPGNTFFSIIELSLESVEHLIVL